MKRNIYKLAMILCTLMLALSLAGVCSAEEITASGMCGDNLTWTFSSDRVLRIEGTGPMWDFHSDAYGCSYCDADILSLTYTQRSAKECPLPKTPWRDSYRVVFIAEGVTRMGGNCFEGSIGIGTMVYPASITNLAWAHNGSVNEVYYYGTPGQWEEMSETGTWESMYEETVVHYAVPQYNCLRNGMHTKTAVCSDCGDCIEEGKSPCLDENLDKVCDLCQGLIPEKIEIVGSNMNLGNELEINFLFMQEGLESEKEYTAVITQAMADGTTEVTRVEQKQWKNVEDYYLVPIGVAAKEMADCLSIEIVDADGNVYSEAYSTSVCDYAEKALSNETMTDDFKCMIVDMLNYGTQAQIYFGYNEENYANSILSQEQQDAYATKDATCTNTQVKGDHCIGANLELASRLLLNVFFSGVTRAELSKVTADVSYVDYRGNVQTANCRVKAYGSDGCVVIVDKIVLADARCPVTVNLYKDGVLYGTSVDSVESYASRAVGKPVEMLGVAILKFADSARTYLLNR